ncbi:MAG: hypothetical protein WKF90_07800 [Pyrinomonadaceae bacterium]
MSKLSRRLDKLFLKTHVFISAKDLLLIKDFRKVILEASNTKPEDFKEDYKRVKEISIAKQYDKFEEIYKENPTLIDAYLYLEAVELCENHPNGYWAIKRLRNYLPEQLQLAKEYFKYKK